MTRRTNRGKPGPAFTPGGALNDVSDAIWVIAPDSTLSYANAAAVRLHSRLFGARAVTGAPVSDLYPAEDRPRWIERYSRAAGGTRVFTMESHQGEDGEEYYEFIVERTGETHEGYPVVAIARSITGRRRTTMQTSLEARAVIDSETFVLSATPTFKKLVGIADGTSISSLRLRDLVDAEDEIRFLEVVERAAEEPRRFERLRIIDLAGVTHETVGVIARSTESGNCALSLMDITEQVETERRLEQGAEHVRILQAWAAELNAYIEQPEILYQRTLELLSNTVRFDSASVQLLRGDFLDVVACAGFSEQDKVLGLSFSFDPKFPNWNVVTSRETIAVTDVRRDYPHFHGDADEFASGDIAAWLGVPLTVRDEVVGMIALDRADPEPFGEEEQQLAGTMAGHIAVAVHNSQLLKALRESEESLSEANRQKETLLRELHHRSKNNMQMISSLLSLGAASVSVEEDGRVLDEVRMRIQSLAAIHEELYKADNLDRVDLADYARRLAHMITSSYGRTGIRVALDTGDVTASIDVSVPFGLILSELVLNAYKHAFAGRAEGTIRVQLAREDGTAVLVVQDDGVGLTQEIVDQSRDSLGMQLVTSLVDQIGGDIDLDNGPGTRWVIRFPVEATQD